MSEQRQRLDSWKAIARHLGCSVRTARRWEDEEGLPVHRQMHRVQASVYAYADELDAWRTRHESRPPSPRTTPSRQNASLAVMPFAFLGADTASDYIADGLTDELIARLSHIRALRVICRTSSMALKGTELSARDVARRLGVTHLLEGTVRLAGERLRISAQLVEPGSEVAAWSAQFDGLLDDVFDLQERIARHIADTLAPRLTPREDQMLSRNPANDVDAWQCVQQSRQSALRWRQDAIDDAIAQLETAVDRLGQRPVLLAALGRTWLQYREAGLDLGEAPLIAARECVDHLARLGDTSPATLLLRGWVAYHDGRVTDAIGELERSMEGNPNDPDTLGLLANCLLISGRVDAARPIIDHLLSIDPLTPLSQCLPGWAAVLEGDVADGLDPYRIMYEMDPGNPLGRLFYVWALALNGRDEEAREIAAGFPQSQQRHPAAGIGVMFGQVLAGQPPAEPPPEVLQAAGATEMFSRILAEVYALAGDHGAARRWLDVAKARGFSNRAYLGSRKALGSEQGRGLL
ncbi:tetratricopeptide repeat protein [Marinihelvus fidelis]|nr:tetratricopeptide repeat protein [Marinihelvus fidelis]